MVPSNRMEQLGEAGVLRVHRSGSGRVTHHTSSDLPPADELVTLTEDGLYCPAGGFHIDPWNAVPRAVITHAHADHARSGCGRYLAAESGTRLLRVRLGETADIRTIAYDRP